MSNKLLVLGYFGFDNNQIDGQTIKTQQILKLVKLNSKTYTQISSFDTQKFQKSKLYYLDLLKEIVSSKTIIYMPGRNNLKFFFPIFYRIAKLFRINIVYVVVGGWLNDFIKPLPHHVKKLRRLNSILVESENLKLLLEKNYALHNINVIPNFRFHTFTPLLEHGRQGFKAVFMSRITASKGIHFIFELASWLKDQMISDVQIDFYGPINDPEKDLFHSSIKRYNFINYKGVAKPSEVNTILSNYDVLLLPTYYDGEGFPGAIVDSYISGVPVIASNWKQIPEFIEHGRTGFLFNLDQKEMFKNYFMKLYNEPALLASLKENALKKSKEYSAKKAWIIINKAI